MKLSRRSLLKAAGGVGAGLALGDLGFDVNTVKAAALKESKIKNAKEFKSICTFCSCGCGMIGHVRDGKLINLEGDPDHIINEGALCSKGAAMAAMPNSDQRIKTPLYRAPGSDRWQTISWDEAITKVAKKIKETRDTYWIASEKDGDIEYRVNRTDALSFMGGAQNNNEECYLMSKMSRLMGSVFVEHQARL